MMRREIRAKVGFHCNQAEKKERNNAYPMKMSEKKSDGGTCAGASGRIGEVASARSDKEGD